MFKKKAIDALTARSSAADAAAVVLTRRISTVAAHVAALSPRRVRDDRYAHALRTSCRRASAAVDLFRPILNDGRARAMKRLLRRIRRAAGPLRDADVLATTIPTLCAAFDHDRSRLEDRLLRRVEARRRDARSLLLRRLRRSDARELRGRLEALLKSARSRPPYATFGALARSAFSRAALRARDRFIKVADDPAQMHSYRVRIKAIRYLFEFAGAAVPRSRSLAPVAIHLSAAVGGLNDLRNAAAFIASASRVLSGPRLRADADDLGEGISEALDARAALAFESLTGRDARRLIVAISRPRVRRRGR